MTMNPFSTIRIESLLILLTAAHGIRITPGLSSVGTPKESPTDTAFHGRRLKSVDIQVPTDPSDHQVTSLPLLPDGAFPTKHWAGHLPASDDGSKYLFYWLFEPDFSKHKGSEDVPLVIWLNGGPGCSSMDGLFLENGPFRLVVNSDGKWEMQVSQHAWHHAPAYVVYIDQPVSTGLSFTTQQNHPRNDEQVNEDFYYFLTEFLKLHGDKFLSNQKLNRPFYFAGESHAGHYIPSMMAYILEKNHEGPEIEMPLSGGAIGNGWTDPMYQYAGAGAAYGIGIIDLAQKASLDEKELQCRADLANGRYTSKTCYSLLDSIVAQSEGRGSSFKVSQYDARKRESKHQSRSFPPGHKDVESYLGGHPTSAGLPPMPVQGVLEAIHATAATDAGQRYMECTDPPFNALNHQDGLGVVPDVIKLLEDSSQIEMLFFNGIWDLICNHVGNEEFLQNMPWKHREAWVKAERYSWMASSDKVSGYMKEFENLKFLKVKDSGHMVPMDVPEVAFKMMQTFMFGGSFKTNEQSLDRALKQPSIECPVCPAPEKCLSLENSTMTTLEEEGGGMKFVVRHSWIGALLAVVAFLAVFWRRRQENFSSTVIPSYRDDDYDLELKEQMPYRDRPNGDADSEDGVHSNGVI